MGAFSPFHQSPEPYRAEEVRLLDRGDVRHDLTAALGRAWRGAGRTTVIVLDLDDAFDDQLSAEPVETPLGIAVAAELVDGVARTIADAVRSAMPGLDAVRRWFQPEPYHDAWAPPDPTPILAALRPRLILLTRAQSVQIRRAGAFLLDRPRGYDADDDAERRHGLLADLIADLSQEAPVIEQHGEAWVRRPRSYEPPVMARADETWEFAETVADRVVHDLDVYWDPTTGMGRGDFLALFVPEPDERFWAYVTDEEADRYRVEQQPGESAGFVPGPFGPRSEAEAEDTDE
jgi:hypothetical protein